jgi:hypothetical protein
MFFCRRGLSFLLLDVSGLAYRLERNVSQHCERNEPVLFVGIRFCHREASLAVGTAGVFAGRLRTDGPVLAQFSPKSGCGGFGLEAAPDDAQAAEITSDDRVRTRKPSFFFMTTPLEIEPRTIRGSERSTPLRPPGLRPPGFFRNCSDYAPWQEPGTFAFGRDQCLGRSRWRGSEDEVKTGDRRNPFLT